MPTLQRALGKAGWNPDQDLAQKAEIIELMGSGKGVRFNKCRELPLGHSNSLQLQAGREKAGELLGEKELGVLVNSSSGVPRWAGGQWHMACHGLSPAEVTP